MDRFHLMNRYRGVCRVLPVLAAVLTGGCAELASIHHSDSLPAGEPHIVSIDAKQRVVLSNPGPTSATGQAIMRFCAEPSPDVFTALATSLGAEASASKSAAAEAAIAAKLAATLSENAATIERTQTVNILREVMYRNCERYLSGAISQDEFIVQAARDQQLIVQVLAVEQITGVARAQSTALLTLSQAASGVTDTGIKALADAMKDLDAKRAASAQAASDARALAPAGACGQNAIDTAKPPDGVTVDQAKAKNAKCEEAKNAASLVKEAESYLGVLEGAVAKQGAVSSETQGKLATAAQTASSASKDIAEKVLEIVRQYQAFDEIGMTCVVSMRRDPSKLPPYCEELLAQMASTRQAQLGLIAEGINPEAVKAFKMEMDRSSEQRAKEVWNRLGQPVTQEELDALSGKAAISIADSHRKRLAEAGDLEAFIRAFARLPKGQQEALAKAAKQ